MKKILRSLCWEDPKERDEATKNFRHVVEERLLDLKTNERNVLEYLLDFFQRKAEAPQVGAVHNHFEAEQKADELVLTEELLGEHFTSGASFEETFEREVEEQAARNLSHACRKAVRIATTGERIGKELVKGTDEAVTFLFSEVQGKPKSGEGKMPASMAKSKDALSTLYQQRKSNPHQTYGIPTGYGLFDSATAGIRPKQLYLHAGFGGHLKSTHMMNMVVNAAVDGGWNPLIFTSEMPAEDVKMLLVAIHSGNPKFAGTGQPLPAFSLLLGSLNQVQEDFFELVKDDLINNQDYGSIRVIDNGEFTTWGSVMQRAVREHMEEEVDVLWCDYITRLPIDAKYRSLDMTTARNETLADAKRFAMGFDGGTGLAVCSPFQINREGYKRGLNSGGKLDKTALAQYNAAEKEADIITYIFFDEEEAATSEPKIGLMKVRYGMVSPQPVEVFIDPDCRRIVDLTAGMTPAAGYAPTSAGADAEDEVEL